MDERLTVFLRAVSRVFGWIYTLSWSASFYPQPTLNWKRRSTKGLSIDFPFLNVVGFSCYTLTTSSLLYSPVIKEQYAIRHPDAPLPTVQLNDEVFNIHALVLVLVTYSQFYTWLWPFDVGHRQKVSRPVVIVTSICALAVLITGALVLKDNGLAPQREPSRWMWIDLINVIGLIKLVVTVTKYIPQAWLNYQRKSTTGWSIAQVLFDLLGGVSSILQLLIDASLQNNWRDIIDNPVKLGLGNISSAFDILFIIQHYILYPAKGGLNHPANDSPTTQPLLQEQS